MTRFPRVHVHLPLCVVCCLAAGSVPAAEVADDGPPEPLQTVEVTAGTVAKDERRTDDPAPGATIDREAIDHLDVGSVEDALQFLPNLHVRKRFAGDPNGTVSVRSASTRQSARTLVYVDGLLLSNFLGSDFTFAPRWSMVSPGALESVQVLYGPFSARFPGNSLGATILLTTHMPERFEGGGSVRLSRQDYDAYGHATSGDGRQYQAWIGDRGGAWSWRLSLERNDVDSQPVSYYSALQSGVAAAPDATPVGGAVPYRDQYGRAAYLFGVNSEGAASAVGDTASFRLAWDFAPEWQAAIGIGGWRQQQTKHTGTWLRDAHGNPVSAGLVAIDGWQYTLPGNAFAPSWIDNRRNLYSASLRSDRADGWNLSVVASRFASPRDVSRTAGGAGSGPGQIVDAHGSGWYTFDAQASYLADMDPANTLALGLHVDRYTLRSATFASDDWRHGAPAARTAFFGGKTRTSALYVEDTWRFAPDWSLNAGLRRERWQAFDGRRAAAGETLAYGRRDDGYWSPKLSLAHALDERWNVRLSLARAYRMPTVSELFQGSVSGTALIDNDPNLAPENAFSKDLSLERRGDDGSNLRLSIYEDDVRDTLFSQTDTTVFPTVTGIQNVDRVRTRGAEVAGQWVDVVPGLDLTASVAHNRAVTLQNRRNPASVGKRFYRIPDWRADLVATYRFNRVLTGTLAGRWSGRQYNSLDNSDINPDTFGGTSRYGALDARLEARLDSRWTLAAGVENLTDERYYVYHPYPGRTWSLEAGYRF